MTKPKNGKTEKHLPLEAQVIQCISNLKAPETTQDAVDQHAAEYEVANLLRSYAEKRYNAIKLAILNAYDTQISAVRTAAADNMMKSTDNIVGVDWTLCFSASKPAERVDVDALRTELIRNGISVTTIDTAIDKVKKKSTPALIIAAVRCTNDK